MRELAISDIHGCLTALDALLELVAPQPDDLLILLGDYVDRGPDTRGVIDRVLELTKSHPRLITLRGNHELMMLDARADGEGEQPVYGGLGFWIGRRRLRDLGVLLRRGCGRGRSPTCP